MVKIGQPYDPNSHEPNKPLDPLPAGWYAMQIIQSEVKKTKDGRGQYLELTHEIMEATHPDFKGRRAWDRLNLWNDSQKAVDIAHGSLAAICRAIGQLEAWDETSVLHGRPLAVKLKLRPADAQFDTSNDVSGYDSVASRFAVGAPVSASTMAAPPPAAAAPPPAAAAPAPVGHQAAPPPQGQPGEAATPPWQK